MKKVLHHFDVYCTEISCEIHILQYILFPVMNMNVRFFFFGTQDEKLILLARLFLSPTSFHLIPFLLAPLAYHRHENKAHFFGSLYESITK